MRSISKHLMELATQPKRVLNYIHFQGLILLLSSIIIMILIFQNCSENEQEHHNSRYNNVPFPFSVNINQISFMSCPNMNSNSSTPTGKPIYGFKVGAYDNSLAFPGANSEARFAGLRLNSNFLNWISPKTPSKIKDVLMNSEYSEGRLVVGLMNTTLQNQTSPPSEGVQPHQMGELGSFPSEQVLSSFGSDDLSTTLSESITRMSSAQTESPSESFSGSLAFNMITSQGRFDKFLYNNGSVYEINTIYSTSSYSGTEFPEFFKKTENSWLGNLYGRKYQFTVGRATSGPIGLSNNLLGLTSIIEREFSGGDNTTPTSSLAQQSWSCFSLVIIRDKDRRASNGEIIPAGCLNFSTYGNHCYRRGCPVQNFQRTISSDGSEINTTSEQQALMKFQLDIVRRFLPADQWEVNVDPYHRCAVQINDRSISTESKCYHIDYNDQSAGVDFSNSATCYNYMTNPPTPVTCPSYIDYSADGATCQDTQGASACPSTVSFCYRNQ